MTANGGNTNKNTCVILKIIYITIKLIKKLTTYQNHMLNFTLQILLLQYTLSPTPLNYYSDVFFSAPCS